MRVVKVVFDRVSGIKSTVITHDPIPSDAVATEKSSSISTKQAGGKATTSDVLTYLMLMCEQDASNINNPKLWMDSSKVLRRIFNSTMSVLNAPAIIADDIKEYEEALQEIKDKKPANHRLIHAFEFKKEMEQNPQLRSGAFNAAQNLKIKIWAKVYYLTMKNDDPRTRKKVAAAKIRELLIKAGYPPADEKSIASDGKVPTERTIETKWLAHLK